MEITKVDYNSKLYLQALALRHLELRKPLNLQFDPQELQQEHEQLHFVGIINTLVVCTCSVIIKGNTAKIRQVATHHSYQHKGYGAELNNFVEAFLKKMEITNIELHARETAVGFYTHLSYHKQGNRFTEVGIPHFKMYKTL